MKGSLCLLVSFVPCNPLTYSTNNVPCVAKVLARQRVLGPEALLRDGQPVVQRLLHGLPTHPARRARPRRARVDRRGVPAGQRRVCCFPTPWPVGICILLISAGSRCVKRCAVQLYAPGVRGDAYFNGPIFWSWIAQGLAEVRARDNAARRDRLRPPRRGHRPTIARRCAPRGCSACSCRSTRCRARSRSSAS